MLLATRFALWYWTDVSRPNCGVICQPLQTFCSNRQIALRRKLAGRWLSDPSRTLRRFQTVLSLLHRKDAFDCSANGVSMKEIRTMTLTETTRNKVILTIFFLAIVVAAIGGVGLGSGVFQALLFAVFAISAGILSTFLVVALD